MILVSPLLLTFIGIVLLSLGVTSMFLWLYQSVELPTMFRYLTLQFIPNPLRGVILLVSGLIVLAAGIWNLSGVAVIRLHSTETSDGEVVLGYRRTRKPPRVVVLSGGAGMLMLANLGEHVENVTCITPVQDPIEYYYRASTLFSTQNVYYVVPTPATVQVNVKLDDGTCMNVMRVNPPGAPIPSLAERHVEQLMLSPEENTRNTPTAPGTPGTNGGEHGTIPLTRLARESLQKADAIILGPGSLFESILPNLLIDDLRTAVQQSKGRIIYICNLMTEPGLTTGFGVGEHIRQIKRYGGFTPDYVLINIQRIDSEVRQLYAAAYQTPVYLSPEESEETTIITSEGASKRHVVVEGSVVIEADLASSVIQYSTSLENPAERRVVRVLRHDPQKLAAAVLEILRWE